MLNINGADMAFVIFSAALVMLMIPGLALFYGGMVRSKNVLSTTMHSYAALIIISVQWMLIGYTLAFGPSIGGFIGGLDFSFLRGVGAEPNSDYASTIPQLLFMAFQMMFAVVTAAVISGSFAERMRFSAFILFILLWGTFVYAPVAHWVWGGSGEHAGWLKQLGILDFAGGFVVEINSGISGLVGAIMLGRRKKAKPEPHHIPMGILGAGILWFGWFGFNAGSALAINNVAVNAFITTNVAAATGAIGWALCEWILFKKPTALGTISGSICGLVAITGGAGFVSPMAALFIGLVGGALSFFAIAFLKYKFKYDDALDAFGCHGISGMWGCIATGLFASKAINPNGVDGALRGNWGLIGKQFIGIFAIACFAGIMTFLILKLISKMMPLRVDESEESTGLDISLHGEEAYRDLSM